MISFAGVVMRNPTLVTKHYRRAYSTYKAMRAYRKKVTASELSGNTKRLQLHHELSISVRPDLADDPNNFIMLTRGEHLHFAHLGNYKNYIENLRDVIRGVHAIKTVRYTQ